jgi:predicted enzyme related to lactoylglutathione lyase
MKLAYLTLLARDVAALAQFYVDGLGLEEVESSRDARYREVKAGGCMIGIASAEVKAMLGLDATPPVGLRALFSLDVGAVTEVASATERALVAGATLIKAPFDTHFGQHLAILSDPEGNVFRLTAFAGA